MLDQNTVSLDVLLDQYIKKHHLRKSSLKNYRGIVRNLKHEMNIFNVNEITLNVIFAWQKNVLDRATVATWNNYYTHLRALLAFALELGLLHDQKLIEIPKAESPKPQKKIVEHISLSKIIELIDRHDERFQPKWYWKTVVKVLFFTGMRQNQLLSLKWKDINFKKKYIMLSVEGKVYRQWRIPLPTACIDELLYLRDQTERQISVLNIDISESEVFRLQLFNDKYSGKSMTGWQLEGFFKRLSKLAGTKISAQRLRHTFATLVANDKHTDLKTLQYILGHTDIRLTQDYKK